MLDRENNIKIAIISDAFWGILNDSTKANSSVPEEEIEELDWIDNKIQESLDS